MVARAKIGSAVQTDVLRKSRRRCCICFGLHRDESVKQGQIAHLDRDRANSNPDNLAYLCLDHHDKYDGRTSQSKNLTMDEVKAFRRELHNRFLTWSDDVFPLGLLRFLASTTDDDDLARGILKVGHQVSAVPDTIIEWALTEEKISLMDGDLYVPLSHVLSNLEGWGLLSYEADYAEIDSTGYIHYTIRQRSVERSRALLEKVRVLISAERPTPIKPTKD